MAVFIFYVGTGCTCVQRHKSVIDAQKLDFLIIVIVPLLSLTPTRDEEREGRFFS